MGGVLFGKYLGPDTHGKTCKPPHVLHICTWHVHVRKHSRIKHAGPKSESLQRFHIQTSPHLPLDPTPSPKCQSCHRSSSSNTSLSFSFPGPGVVTFIAGTVPPSNSSVSGVSVYTGGGGIEVSRYSPS